MSDQDVKQISNVTGTFRALQLKAEQAPPSGKVTPETGKGPPVEAKTKPDLEELARQLNVATRSIGRDLRFEVNMDSGRSVIQVLDRETGEVIRQIPPEKTSLYHSETGAVALRLYDEQV
ncbi:MAG: flagellar protein FlaG [Woeseiaceae bacterium]